jgi:PHD/YefM family antitoxin component YafN of YafNO toxin-antitoxin module
MLSSMTDLLEKFQSSDLNRNPTKVFDAAEHNPILVTRRDGEDLVLMSEREATARRKLVELAAELIAVTTDDRGTLVERMSDRFPWMMALKVEDRARCAKDLVDAARASFATQQAHLAIAELTAWRETSSAVAEGLSLNSIDWLDEPGPVSSPLA